MFKFKLHQLVRIVVSGEVGEVLGRAEYANNCPPSYFLRYTAANGVASENWWAEDALHPEPQQ